MYPFWHSIYREYFLFSLILAVSLIAIISISYNVSQQQQYRRELNCLALNIYHEARGEPDAGQYAVAQVTLNRVLSSRFPDTICKVVYEKKWDTIRHRYVGAFSWTELAPSPALDKKTWRHARKIAKDVYSRHNTANSTGALFYHADYIEPSWAKHKTRVAKIGQHIFYK